MWREADIEERDLKSNALIAAKLRAINRSLLKGLRALP
jgi:hypothetical protein